MKILSIGLMAIASFVSCNVKASAIDDFIYEMAVRHGFDQNKLVQMFSQVEIKNSVLSLMKNQAATPASKKAIWTKYDYDKKFVDWKRVEGGMKFIQKYANTFAKAETQYGVPAEVISAIIGIETLYGHNVGSTRVLDALTTLAFYYPARADFFRKELEEFLLMTREENLNPLAPKGSFAGAMGIGQFMPSSYRKLAIDFDGDGQRDLWNPEDAIGSVAHYLQKNGWARGEPIIIAAQAVAGYANDLAALTSKPTYSLAELQRSGLICNVTTSPNMKLGVLAFNTEWGKVLWASFNNFQVIKTYNNTNRYAMGVTQLAEAIRHARQVDNLN
jgi:membrane-bound lytic murein transglycosylase B